MTDELTAMRERLHELESAEGERLLRMQVNAALKEITLATIDALKDSVAKFEGNDAAFKSACSILARCQINAEMLERLAGPSTELVKLKPPKVPHDSDFDLSGITAINGRRQLAGAST